MQLQIYQKNTPGKIKMKKTVFLMAAILTGIVLRGEEFVQKPPVVGVAVVALENNRESRKCTGQIVSRSVVRLVARVSGEIREIGFRDGETVREGQVLYRLDPIQYEAAAKSAEAKVAECQARLSYAQNNYDRNKLLHQKHAASLDAMENAKSIFDAARAALLAAEAELITAQDNLSRTVITAPVDGVAGVTNFTAGNYVTPEAGTLVTVVQTQPIRVRFSISAADYLSLFGSFDALKANSTVRIRLADGTIYPETGTVELLNNEINPGTDTVQIYARFENKDSKLMSGGTVGVILSREGGAPQPAVAPAAVMHDADGTYVFVVDSGNKAEKRYVETGYVTKELQTISGGLAAGEKVIVKGTHKVMPGTLVDPRG